MKLSEAMRRGSRKLRQVFGSFGDGKNSGCALMMVAVGCGLESAVYDHITMAKLWPILHEKCILPVVGWSDTSPTVDLWEAILLFNDRHHWSVGRIAGWVEANIETPTYSLLDIQHYMENPVSEEVTCVR